MHHYPQPTGSSLCVSLRPLRFSFLHPSRLIVFASARKDRDSPGYVDFRHDGKAVIATFDGGAKLASEEELRDMRFWSNQASIAGDPNFTISR